MPREDAGLAERRCEPRTDLRVGDSEVVEETAVGSHLEMQKTVDNTPYQHFFDCVLDAASRPMLLLRDPDAARWSTASPGSKWHD
jgi:hypothetical protein